MAIGVMYECIPYVLEFGPDPPWDIRFVQEMGQEHPKVNLVAEFRRARDWLDKYPRKRPKSDLHGFLRNWVNKAVRDFGAGQPRIIGYETEVVFVPADEQEGGETNAGESSG
jgi:hypothetical protein